MDALTIVLLVISFAIFVYQYFVKGYRHFSDKGIPCVEPRFPFGSTKELVLAKKFNGELVQEIYNKFPDSKYVGFINVTKPQLLVKDPDLIKQIISKDFKYFTDRVKLLLDEKEEPLNQHLFHMSGERWKNMRVKLTPTFTSGKMKLMFFLMKTCADHLQNSLNDLAEKGEVVNINDFMGRYTTDVIGTCAFGLEINSIEHPDSEFRKMGHAFFTQTKYQIMRALLRFIMPRIVKLLKLKVIDKRIEIFFTDVVKDTVEYREANKIQRNDFLDLLIQIKNQGSLENDDNGQIEKKTKVEMDLNTMTAQCLLFFVAGFETSSLTLTYTLYELALNTDIQQKLQKEIDTVLEKHSGQVTYEALQEMPYMDKVVSETMRLYPPLPTLIRECNSKYHIPETDHFIEAGTRIVIPLFALHRDPRYFPDPDKYDPENFNEDRIKERHRFTYLPFGEGPRICLGLRFGLMQVKMGLTALLSKFNVSAVDQTPVPIQFNPKTFTSNPASDIPLRVSLRTS